MGAGLNVQEGKAQEKLVIAAGRVTGELIDKLAALNKPSLPTLDKVFPGAVERFTGVIRDEYFREQLSKYAAQEIAGLIKQGTEKSLIAAILKVRELNELLQYGGVTNLTEVQAAMIGRFVGPDSKLLLGKEIGMVQRFPRIL